MLFLSRLDPKKNVEGLLRALNLLPAEFGDLALVVCGDGAVDYSAELRRLADTLGIADRVVWTGRLEGEAKSAALAAADLFLLPSFSENFGIAAVEALAAGLPCVLGRGVAIAEEIQAAGAGVCVDAAPEAIAEGIRRVVRDGARRQSAAAQAQRLADERYSSTRMGEDLRRLYCRILAH